MHTEGTFAPDSIDAAAERYADLGPTAQVVVKEVAKAMSFDSEEYERRVTSDVVETARHVLFAAELAVHVGTREEYETWLADSEYPIEAWTVEEIGADAVDNVAWHAAPAVETVVAATFQNEPEAAVGTLRRQALGQCYRNVI